MPTRCVIHLCVRPLHDSMTVPASPLPGRHTGRQPCIFGTLQRPFARPPASQAYGAYKNNPQSLCAVSSLTVRPGRRRATAPMHVASAHVLSTLGTRCAQLRHDGPGPASGRAAAASSVHTPSQAIRLMQQRRLTRSRTTAAPARHPLHQTLNDCISRIRQIATGPPPQLPCIHRFEPDNALLRPAYFIATDHPSARIVWGIRGTKSMHDVLTNAMGAACEAGPGRYAHEGMLQVRPAAQRCWGLGHRVWDSGSRG
jgi:hypothetical protein